MTGTIDRLRAGTVTLALLAGFAALAAVAAPAAAAPTTRHVSTTGTDTGDCSGSPCLTVQYAVDQALAGDTIDIGSGEYKESVHLRKSLTLHGAGSTGSGKTIIDGDQKSDPSIFVDGLDVDGTVDVTVKDIAVDGNPVADGIDVRGAASLDLVDSSSSNNHGMGVRLDAPALGTIENSTVDGNASHGVGYGTAANDNRALAAADADQLKISNSDVSDNGGAGVLAESTAATIEGSTLNRNAESGVGVAAVAGHLTISNSTLDANTLAGVFSLQSGGLTITHSTISNSKPLDGQEQGLTFGAGVLVLTGIASIDNSTIADNTGEGVLGLEASITVDNSTISGTKPAGKQTFNQGGLVLETREAAVAGSARKVLGLKPSRNAAAAPAAPEIGITVTGSIVAEQGTKVPDCAGNVSDGGYNLSSDEANSCKFSAAKHDQVTTDPLLGPLANNGGPTQTEILKKLSPAIDAIPDGQANCSTGADDQRGIERPQPAGGKCDIGAVELKAKALAIHPDSLPNGTVGKAYHATITATGGQYPIYTFAFVSGTLPDGLALDSHGKIAGTPTKAGTFHFTVSVNDPVLKDYTIVIDDASTSGSGTEPVSNTGVPTGTLLAVGGGAVFAGFLLLLYVGKLDRRARGPRIVYGRHLKK